MGRAARTGGIGRILSLILSSGLAGTGLTAVGLVALASPAAAQSGVTPVDPYNAVVTRDNAEIRASDGTLYYAVRLLKAGQILRVDGQTNGWLRVVYPEGSQAYVKAEEVKEAGTQVELKQPSRLQAANLQMNEKSHWWFLLEKELPAGTKLDVLQPLKGANGNVHGYLVKAPADSKGFVKNDFLRKASAEELAAAGLGPAPAAPTTPATPTTPSTPATPANTPGTTTPATPTTPGTTTPAAGTPESTTPAAQPGATTPTTTQPTIEMTPLPSTTNNPAAATPAAPTPPEPKKASIETLKQVYADVQTQRLEEAEFDAAIAEFHRVMDDLGETGGDSSLRRLLGQRLAVLEMRQQLQNEIRETAERTRVYTESSREVSRYLEQIEANPLYTMVGRILPSTVYNGQDLPLMYRVESADSGMTRTLGYVIPTDDLDVLPKVGRVVGIAGKARYDEALRVNVVAATRMDLLAVRRTDAGSYELSPLGETDTAREPDPIESEPEPEPTEIPQDEPANNSGGTLRDRMR